MMVQRRSRGRGSSSHRHRHSIFKFLLLVLIGVIFIYVTPTTDYFLTTKTIGRTKAKIRTINTNVTNPIEIKTVKTRNNKDTSTPFQKQYIFQINYHKTGHAISFQYRTILRNLLQQNNKGIGKDVKGSINKKDSDNDNDDDSKSNSNSNSNFDSDYELLSTIMTANNSIHTLKRTHSNETGCPTKQQFWNTLLLNNKTTTTDTDSDTIVMDYVNAGSLDLFCNIDENDLFNMTNTHNKKYDGNGDDDNSDGNGNGGGNGKQQNQNYHHDIKIIHLIRNPIDMVVSAYLYHSQSPTPEVWVKKKHGVFYNPCNLNYDIIQFYDRLKSSTEEDFPEQQFDIISQKDVDQIEVLCHTLMYNNDTKQPYVHLYDALTKLSSIHGVQLMTIQLLLSNFHSGSDLLRMVLNIIRLNQWSSDRNNMKNKNNNNKILTLEMGNDWSFNYTDTVTRTTQFIVEDLEDLLVLQQQQQQHKSISSTNNFELLKAMTNSKQKFITTVTSLMKEQKKKVKIRNDKHFTSTTTKWSKEEKDTIIDQLLSDELLGPILFKLQQVTNTAIGLTKHQ